MFPRVNARATSNLTHAMHTQGGENNIPHGEDLTQEAYIPALKDWVLRLKG